MGGGWALIRQLRRRGGQQSPRARQCSASHSPECRVEGLGPGTCASGAQRALCCQSQCRTASTHWGNAQASHCRRPSRQKVVSSVRTSCAGVRACSEAMWKADHCLYGRATNGRSEIRYCGGTEVSRRTGQCWVVGSGSLMVGVDCRAAGASGGPASA